MKVRTEIIADPRAFSVEYEERRYEDSVYKILIDGMFLNEFTTSEEVSKYLSSLEFPLVVKFNEYEEGLPPQSRSYDNSYAEILDKKEFIRNLKEFAASINRELKMVDKPSITYRASEFNFNENDDSSRINLDDYIG